MSRLLGCMIVSATGIFGLGCGSDATEQTSDPTEPNNSGTLSGNTTITTDCVGIDLTRPNGRDVAENGDLSVFMFQRSSSLFSDSDEEMEEVCKKFNNALKEKKYDGWTVDASFSVTYESGKCEFTVCPGVDETPSDSTSRDARCVGVFQMTDSKSSVEYSVGDDDRLEGLRFLNAVCNNSSARAATVEVRTNPTSSSPCSGGVTVLGGTGTMKICSPKSTK